MQSLITSPDWNMTALAVEKTTSYHIGWYVYGSGSRLSWQWATGAGRSILVLTLVFDVYPILRYRKALGLWLTLGGIVNAANARKRLRKSEQAAQVLHRRISKGWGTMLKHVGGWKAEITDYPTNGTVVEKGK
ncbi:hypothetical protein GJ744_008885 [Endocarpon pusillum]|uniref:Uncharacterized protein n=1 Tax=Endocarpon pusillum TaxID=364733 RepID=A0A8H7AV58_9EURO|nr:hypothetical protein GJ744_008885 [Endocarpon pusillum]